MRLARITTAMTICAIGSALSIAPATAQDSYPSRPVRIIIGFGPASGTDIIARFLAEELRQTFNQPFVVENRPGASAQIAATAVKAAAPDGHTLFITSNSSHSVNPHIFKKLPYDPIADFTPIGGIAYFPFVLAVDPRLPIKSPQDLVDWARANKGKVNYAYGTPAVQIPAEALNRLMKLEALGVPYKSSPQAMTDVISGLAAFLVVDLASSRPHIRAGKLQAIAVTTGKRSALAPELPTIEESLGLADFDLAAWSGLFGPAGLPRDVVEKLAGSLQKILTRPDVRERLQGMGAEVTPSSPSEFAALVAKQLDVWGRKVRDAGIQPE